MVKDHLTIPQGLITKAGGFLHPIHMCNCLTHKGRLYYVLRFCKCSSSTTVDQSLLQTFGVVALPIILFCLGGLTPICVESPRGKRG